MALIYWEGEKDRLLDWENGQAHFDSDEFVRFLEALENYNPPVQMSNIAESVYWQKDEIYLHETLIFSIFDTGNKSNNRYTKSGIYRIPYRG